MQREKHVWNEAEEEMFERMDFWKKEDQKKQDDFRFVYKKKTDNNDQA